MHSNIITLAFCVLAIPATVTARPNVYSLSERSIAPVARAAHPITLRRRNQRAQVEQVSCNTPAAAEAGKEAAAGVKQKEAAAGQQKGAAAGQQKEAAAGEEKKAAAGQQKEAAAEMKQKEAAAEMKQKEAAAGQQKEAAAGEQKEAAAGEGEAKESMSNRVSCQQPRLTSLQMKLKSNPLSIPPSPSKVATSSKILSLLPPLLESSNSSSKALRPMRSL
jgi:hypothetical protein